MTVVKELREGLGTLNLNGGVLVDAQRTFQVRAASEEAAVTDPDLPFIGQAYSGSTPLLIATNRRAVGQPDPDPSSGQQLFRVQVGYTYQAIGIQSNPVNENVETYRDDLIERQDIQVTVPRITERRTFIDQPIPLAPIEFFLYEAQFINLNITGTRYRINVNISADDFDPEVFEAAVVGQGQNIHTFGGRQRWFSDGQAYRRDADVYGITYEWISDPGNGELTTTLGATGPPVTGGDPDAIVPIPARAPFEKYVPQSYIDTATGLSKQAVTTIAERLVVPNGWTNLVGLT